MSRSSVLSRIYSRRGVIIAIVLAVMPLFLDRYWTDVFVSVGL